ncbi:MAG: helix-turn-helix domain-containing protein [Lachnospiraceae bacterium]|nr:helix-turn-helix domain-containing protein [Lachnospiraceae bacterium]
MAKLNERIKERRLSSGLTLLQVAEEIGIKEATMQRYESGEIKNIKHETIEKLAKIFNCSPEYLMGWSDREKRLSTYYDAVNKKIFEKTIAAHKEDNENWTPEELKKIEEYKQLLLAARKNDR